LNLGRIPLLPKQDAVECPKEPWIGAVRILFTSSIPYLPQIYGGLNTNTHELCLELVKRGYRPSVLTRLSYANPFGMRTLLTGRIRGRKMSCDVDLGYPVFRAREPWRLIHETPRPDVSVMQDGHMLQFADALNRRGIPAISYFHGLDFEDWTIQGRPATAADLPRIQYFANSNYTAERFRRRYGMDACVVPPVFRPELYRTRRLGRNVVFINPVREKGVELALDIAAICREIPFIFVKGWPLTIGDYWHLNRRLRRLSNVRLVQRCSDMREIFEHCHILLVPSKWSRETWGRVASEAHFSGVPVIGSNIGGLPEAIGPGGIVIEPGQPAEVWAGALRQLWYDDELYLKKSCEARTYSERAQLNLDHQIELLVTALKRAAAGGREAGCRRAVAGEPGMKRKGGFG
jgi:glycosyltransferase involved in cell wall biosynthesis